MHSPLSFGRAIRSVPAKWYLWLARGSTRRGEVSGSKVHSGNQVCANVCKLTDTAGGATLPGLNGSWRLFPRGIEKMLNAHLSIRLSSLCLGGLLLSAHVGWAEPNAGDATTSSKSAVSSQNKEVAKKEEARHPAGTIPDAKNQPILTKNAVTIAGQRVSYVAETGMLPLLKSDGTVRASIFYVAYMKAGREPHGTTAGDVLLQRRSGVGLRVAASRRAGAEASEIERNRRGAARPVRAGGQRVFHPARYRSGVHRSGGHRLQSAGRRGQGRAVFR